MVDNRVRKTRVYDASKINDVIDGRRQFDVEEKLVDEKFNENLKDVVLDLQGNDFTLKFIQKHGFKKPILFKNKDGLGLEMPDPQLFSISDVRSYVGSRRLLDVFDCETHQASQMSVYQWVKYYTGSERDKILNVTSLECSHTGLDRLVKCPDVVQDHLDWVQMVWPKHLIAEQKDTTNSLENMKYPKIRKYCLMSVAGCYTDFHIDFGGTSVWYHILKGAKVFWLIPPTENNLMLYQNWVLSGRQQDVFLGDIVDQCHRVHLIAGDTFMIPTGWIHSVYTPDDSLVFGGNFIHSYNIPLQLRAVQIEENTHVPKKLCFPFFFELHWYMIKAYVEILERDVDERRLMEFDNTSHKSKWSFVYFTSYEIEGLKEICSSFRSWPSARNNFPANLKEDTIDLLDRLEELLQCHEEDDQVLACRGINIFAQFKTETPSSTPPAKCNSPSASESPAKKLKLDRPSLYRKCMKKSARKSFRRVRCRECEGCLRENCNECRYCRDMPKNGGPNVLRQSCSRRFCQNPKLPSYVECCKCRLKDAQVLMECSICSDIVHPSCLQRTSPCKISTKINNCWECPECCLDSQSETFTEDKINGHMSDYKRKVIERIKFQETQENKNPLRNNLMIKKVQNLKVILQKAKLKQESIKMGPSKQNDPVMFPREEKQPIGKSKVAASEDAPSCPIRPLPLREGENVSRLPKQCWVRVFGYLCVPDLCVSMLVCRSWNEWCLDGSLWRTIDLSNKRITHSLLCGVIRRQPIGVNLSSSNINGEQLQWLLERLPRLQSLNLSLSNALTASCLSRITCPPLLRLDLSWSECIYDEFVIELLANHKLKGISQLALVGCDIADLAITVILSALKSLKLLDISHCSQVTEEAFALLHSRERFALEELICIGCSFNLEGVNVKVTSLC